MGQRTVVGRRWSVCAGLQACLWQTNPQRRSIFSLPLEALVLNRASHHEATFSKSLAWVFFAAFLCLEMA